MASADSNEKEFLRHVVIFAFKVGTPEGTVREIEQAFCDLPQKISEIRDFEWGTDVSVENKQQGFTHCFFLTFHSEKDRDSYLPHPEHKKFGSIVAPHVAKVLVVDYWARSSA